MAIARGAGTEIIRSVHADDIDSTVTVLIVGVQHHIYTVLSIVYNAYNIQAADNWVQAGLEGYDSKQGRGGRSLILFRQDMSDKGTFVWNDKFSFNGTEPTDFTGPITANAAGIVMQDAIADQGSTTSQFLWIATEHASDGGQVTVTFIDQNNA